MRELILSDITLMGPGYCVIGLEKVQAESYRSVRPMPPWGFAWREPFPFVRGDRVRFHVSRTAISSPHVEDLKSQGLTGAENAVSEDQLVASLRRAELANNLHDLFGCGVQASDRGGHALWVNPDEAKRSICGCEYDNFRFRVFPEPQGYSLRAELVTASNERMSSIPVVDRDWNRFVVMLVARIQRADPLPLAERFMNRTLAGKMLSSPLRFARIGLPRPREDRQCWLMLDSLFPQPNPTWLDLL
jgi:hypothetical protein